MTAIDTSDVATLRRLNAGTTLECLRREPQRWFTVRELSDLTVLSRPTVSRVLDDLEKVGWAISQAGVPGATGRPARRFRFNAESGLAISIDAGPSQFDLAVSDLSGAILLQESHTSLTVHTLEDYRSTVLETTRSILEKVEITAPVRAVAVSLPGPVAEDGTLRTSAYAPSWVGWNVRDLYEDLFPDAAISLAHDIDNYTVAELASGALQGVKSAVFVLFSDSCYSNIVVDGEVVTGAHGLAGARSQPHGVGAMQAPNWIALRDQLYANHPRKRMSQIIAAAKEGNQKDIDLLTAYAQGLAPRIAFMMRALAPELLLVGGQMMALPEIALPPLRAAVLEAAGLDGELDETDQRIPEVRLAHYDGVTGSPVGGIHAALEAMNWQI